MPATVKNSMGLQHALCQFFNEHDKRKVAVRYNCPLAYLLKNDFYKTDLYDYETATSSFV